MIKSLSPIYDLIRADGSIIINKNLRYALGLNESIIYSELLSKFNYFCIREQLSEDGYFFNTVDNLLLDTGFDSRSQRTSIKRLKDFGLIDYKVNGMPPKRYFKIIDDTQIILSFIENGRQKREELEKKLLESADTSKLRLNAHIKKSIMPETINALSLVNNTKPNNTKPNNTKERYITITSDDNMFLKIYNGYYKMKFDKPHMRVKTESFIEIKQWFTELISCGITKDDWVEAIEKHFADLPTKNNGNILSFMESSHRYFEIGNPKQLNGGY